ncbi:MAG: glycoside hydrolase family 3 N-terminal domain-containing protein [Salinibacter sp.]
MRLSGLVLVGLALVAPPIHGQPTDSLYHDGWVDFNKNGRQDPYENPALPTEKRIDDLIDRMTLAEKTMQLVTLYGYNAVLEDPLPQPDWKNELRKDGLANIDEQHNGVRGTEYAYPYPKHVEAIHKTQRWFVEETRLGIPVDFTNEGIRGLTHYQATSFPAQIGQASTWNEDLIYQIGRITGREARALGYTNIYSPILDVARDPRWGRTVETYGESPFLVSALGTSAVKGLQSQQVVSTPKHFAVYSVPKGGRDGSARTDPHVTPRAMHQLYLRPFRQAFQEAGALGTMSSYNDWNGLPITGSRYFLTELLREQYGFEGYVVSDSRAVEHLHEKHHVAANQKEAVRQAVKAGLNVRTDFSPPAMYVKPLRELVREGSLSETLINRRVRDVLRVKFWQGLFDDPFVGNPDTVTDSVRTESALETSLRAARESMVLLKNEKATLPLDADALDSILVTGPLAQAEGYADARYGPNHLNVTSVLEGIRRQVGEGVTVRHERGVAALSANWPQSELYDPVPPDSVQAGIDRAVQRAETSDVVVAVLGETEEAVGESHSRTSLNLPGYQQELLKAVHATGTPVVLVLVNGRPLTINWADRHVPAILESWYAGENSGRAVADVLFGVTNPGGKLPITFPRTVGQIPYNAPYKPGSQAGQPDWSGRDTRVQGALYPFGHGLSYTTFAYDHLRIEPDSQQAGGSVTVSFEVTNTGDRPGDEVPQLYLRDPVSSVTTYRRRLRGFDRISLKPGETKTVSMTLGPKDLRLLDRDMNWTVEAGTFEVRVGRSSQDIRLQSTFRITTTASFGGPPPTN